MHDFGHLDDLAKSKSVDLSGQLAGVNGFNLNPGMQDNADQVNQCTVPYQIQIVDPGTGIGDLLTNAVSGKEMINGLITSSDRAERVTQWSILGPIWSLFDTAAKFWGMLADKAMRSIGGANQVLASIANSEMLFNFLSIVTLGGLRKHKRVMTYVNDLRYPIGLPTAAEAAVGWLGGTIDDCTFQTYVEANDSRFLPYKQIVMAGRFKFSALELMTLYKRQKLTRGTIQSRLRELGSLETQDVQELEGLYEQIPGPADLIRMMLRDVENPQVVGTFDLDNGFTDNYQGTLKDWGGKQGLADQVMQYEWRAHWSIPSPTQLYDMLHKLRHNPPAGMQGSVEDNVRIALKQQDILPYWIEPLMSVSYHPLTRTDLNRAYERGWIADADYLTGMYNNGYSDDDSKTLLRFAGQERAFVMRHLPEVTMFANADITQQQLSDELQRQGWDASVIPLAIDEGIQQKLFRHQREAIDAITRQYRACRITLDEAHADARELGIDIALLDLHLDIASLNSTCGTRREWASQLCSALSEGLITADDYVSRMKMLKYDDTAIQVQLALCQNKMAAQKAKQALKDQEQADKDAKAAQRAKDRAAKEAAQQAKRLAGIAQANERRRQSRNAKLAHATEQLGSKLSDVTGPPADLVTTLFHALQTGKGLSQDEAAQVLAIAATGAKGMTTNEFVQWVTSDSLSMLAEPWTLFPVG